MLPMMIVTLIICVLMTLPYVALEFGIVYLCSHGSSSCCLGLTVALLSVFSFFVLMLPWTD